MERSAAAEAMLRDIDEKGASRRSDAVRNRERVIRASLEIFAEHGKMGTVEQVAARAGVGRATVYRSFPTRDALLVAVATSQFVQVHAIALEVQRHSAGSGLGLVDFAFGAFEYNQANRLYLELFDGRPTEEMLDVHTASRRTITELFDEARATGMLRPEIGQNDFAMFVGGMSVRLALDHLSTQEDWRRIATAALRGIGVPAKFLPPRRIPLAHRPGGLLSLSPRDDE